MPSTRFKLKAPLPKEADHQAYFFDWVERIGQHRWPELKWTYAIPNGASYYGQHRYAEAAKQRAMGLRRGVPDVCVPWASCSHFYGEVHYGLYIEFKRSTKDHLKPEQIAYRDYLIDAGYAYARCNSGQEAIAVVEAYMMGRFVQDDADQGHKD